MAGPYCKDCRWWVKMIRCESGECNDPSKRIYRKHEEAKNEPPETDPTDSCSNWRVSGPCCRMCEKQDGDAWGEDGEGHVKLHKETTGFICSECLMYRSERVQ